jgi:CRP/FNR family transcriptional regulator
MIKKAVSDFDEILSYLRSCFIFRDLTGDELTLLAGSGEIKKFKAGQIIKHIDQNDEAFYLVITGRVKLVRTSYEGKEQILSLFGSGEVFCLLELVPGENCPGEFIAMEESTLFVIPPQEFRHLILTQPNIMFKILSILTYKLKTAMDTIVSFSLLDVPQRVAAFFVQSISFDRNGERIELNLNISRKELAKIVGVTPETMSRVIKKMEEKGLIGIQGRDIQILKPEVLDKLSSGELRLDMIRLQKVPFCRQC